MAGTCVFLIENSLNDYAVFNGEIVFDACKSDNAAIKESGLAGAYVLRDSIAKAD